MKHKPTGKTFSSCTDVNKKSYRKCSGRMSAEGLRSDRKNWHEGLIMVSLSNCHHVLKVSSHIIFHVEPLLHAMRCTARMTVWSHHDTGREMGCLPAEDQTQVKAPSFWLSSCCLPRLQPGEERLCSNQRRGTCSESSCHRVSPPSGPREHLSLSLNWVRNLIKNLFRDEGIMLITQRKRNTWYGIQNWTALLLNLKDIILALCLIIFPYIPAWSAPFVLSDSLLLFTAPQILSCCQPDSTVTTHLTLCTIEEQ